MRPRELHAARTVADVMTDELRPIVSEMPLHQASRLLVEQKARALPVVDREGHVVGVLGEEELLVRFGPRRRRPWWRVFARRDQLAQE
jgi:CBS-domain-containing membrane protein